MKENINNLKIENTKGNSKLNNYLINSNNLASLSPPRNSTNLLSDNLSTNKKKTTFNLKTYNNFNNNLSIKSKSVFDNKLENTIKLIGNISKGNLFNINASNSIYSNNANNGNNISFKSNNKKIVSRDKSNNLNKKKISFLRKNLENTILTAKTNSNISHNINILHNLNHNKHSLNSNSVSPIANKSAKFPLAKSNLNIKQSRNKQNEIYKLRTNSSNINKHVSMNFNTENNCFKNPQSNLKGNPNNILNTKLFDFLTDSEDKNNLIKETTDINTIKVNNCTKVLKAGVKVNNSEINLITKNLACFQSIKNNIKNLNSNVNSLNNLSKDSKIINKSRASTNINNINSLNSNSILPTNSSKEKSNINISNNSNVDGNKKKNLVAETQHFRESIGCNVNKLKLKSDISNANNFIKNKVTNINKNNNLKDLEENKIAKSNNEILIDNPYIINSIKNFALANTSNLITNANQKLAKNKSLNANLFKHNNIN
jgi:hypothetical protein